MKHAPAILHTVALVVLFATFGQPGHPDKPSGVRRAVEASGGPVKAKTFLDIRLQRRIRVADSI